MLVSERLIMRHHANRTEKGVTRPQGCRMSIIEAVWKPDE